MDLQTKLRDYFSEIYGETSSEYEKYIEICSQYNLDFEGISFEHKNWIVMHVDDSVLLNEIFDTETETDSLTLFPVEQIEVFEVRTVATQNSIDRILEKFLVNRKGLTWFMKLSVENYIRTGEISGCFKKQLEEMIEYAKKEK